MSELLRGRGAETKRGVVENVALELKGGGWTRRGRMLGEEGTTEVAATGRCKELPRDIISGGTTGGAELANDEEEGKPTIGWMAGKLGA